MKRRTTRRRWQADPKAGLRLLDRARPGAMDAFALPSRRFDRREYRDGRVEGVAQP